MLSKCGLGVMNSIPDATTVAFFRERLRKAEPAAMASIKLDSKASPFGVFR